MIKFRFTLRLKLLLLSCVLLTLPWFGYQYVWEMEKYLRFGQEQTIVGTARALATALHERPNLFENQASFLPSVDKGKDLYSYQLTQAIQLDGLNIDWPHFDKRSHYYGEHNQVLSNTNNKLSRDQLSLHFNATIGKYDKYLYLFFNVVDNKIIYRQENARSIVNNDHIEIALDDGKGNFYRYIISNKQAGWLDGYQINNLATDTPITSPQLQGNWLETPQGYNVELRLPLSQLGEKLAFVVHDVDQIQGDIISSIGSSDTSSVETLGTVLVPSPEIERIVKGMSYTNSSIWVVDQHHRVLASSGKLVNASGVWRANDEQDVNSSIWSSFKNNWLLPLYYQFLTKPPKDFIDKLYDAQNLTGSHIDSALMGKEKSTWRLSDDQQAVILSAAYPIFINNKVKGAVIVEETTNGIRTVRNKALEKLFSAIISILLLGALVFFIFASRTSGRIIKLRNQAEHAIDQQGRIQNELKASKDNDEIGDLSRSFTDVINRLSQYNHYLENMSSRLSHELRTPIAVVRSSLDNLAMQQMPEGTEQYLERAQVGIKRLNTILTKMSEATRLEQMLLTTDKEIFDLKSVLASCIQGYRQIHPEFTFNYHAKNDQSLINGSADHIAQLFDKIITNAVEFSEDKIIAIELEAIKNNWQVTIKNVGNKLPDNMKDRLFDSMVSVRKEKQTHTPHLGLGLYIARLITQFHHGSIKAENLSNPDGVALIFQFPQQNR